MTNTLKLVLVESGRVIEVGDRLPDFRGDMVTVQGMTPPRHSGSTGRVYVLPDGSTMRREFFPSVIGAAWVAADAQ